MILILENKWSLTLIAIMFLIVREIAKSIRIEQLKRVDKAKIEAIGNYEKKSKIKYHIPKTNKNKDSSLCSE